MKKRFLKIQVPPSALYESLASKRLQGFIMSENRAKYRNRTATVKKAYN